MSEEQTSTDIFNKETTFTQTPQNTVKFLILQYQERAFIRWLYYLDSQEGSSAHEKGLRRFKASLLVLYERVRPRLIKRKDYLKTVEEKPIEEAIEKDPVAVFNFINDYLENDLKLTKIDNYRDYNHNNLSERNKLKLGY